MSTKVELLASEKNALDLVTRISTTRATRLLELLGSRFTRRYNKHYERGGLSSLNLDSFYFSSDWEKELFYNLKLGLSLSKPANPAKEAHARILERIKQRNAKRKLRLETNQLSA